jgi:hypothetical protein
MSYILWYPLHVILSFSALFLHWLVDLLHGCLVQPGLDDDVTDRQRILVDWLKSREKAIKTHWRYIKDGLGESIVNCAINTQEDGDRKIVTRLFSLLAPGDKSKLRQFAASIPRNRVSKLIPLIESGRIVLRESLLTLLRSCATSTSVADPDEDVRKRSLLVCLDAIYYIAKTPKVPDLEFVRASFANIGLMQDFWDDSDTAIRFNSRSICALVAKQVFREALDEPQIRWLHEVTKEQGRIDDSTLVERDRMNLKSFLYGVFSKRVEDLPIESFKDTLAILLDVGNDDFGTNFRNRLTEEVGWIQQQDPQGSREIVDRLCLMFHFLPRPRPLPPAPAAPLTAAFPSHYGVPPVDPRSYLVTPSSDVTVPFPAPQLTHSHPSNVPRGL